MSETQETPQKIYQAAYQEMDEEQKLNFKEFYPVNEPFGYIGINIERKTGKLQCLTCARSSLAWVRLDAVGTYPFEGSLQAGPLRPLSRTRQSIASSAKKQPCRRRPNELGQADS